MAASFAAPEGPVESTPPKPVDYIAEPPIPPQPSVDFTPKEPNAYSTEQVLPLAADSSGTPSHTTSPSLTSSTNDLPIRIPNYHPQTPKKENNDESEFDSDGFDKCLKCCCCGFLLLIFLSMMFGKDDGPPLGTPSNPFPFASSFVDQGSIDDQTVNICDGNFEYSVSSSGHFQ